MASIIDAANINLLKDASLSLSIIPAELVSMVYQPKDQSDKKPRSRTRSKKANKTSIDDIKIDSSLGKKIYDQAQKIDPISITLTNTNNIINNGITGDIPISYKFGFKESLEINPVTEIGFDTGFNDNKKSLSIRSGIRLASRTSLNLSFNQNINSNINGFNIDTRSSSTDFVSYGKNLSKGLPFMNWSLRISGLEKIPFISTYVDAMSLEHSFSGKKSLAWKFNDSSIKSIGLLNVSDFDDQFKDSLQFSKTVSSFTPLIGITTTYKNGISTNIRTNNILTLQEVPYGQTFIAKNSLLGSITYNFTRGVRVPLPFSGRNIFLKNNFNITFNFDVNNSNEKGSKDKINFVEQNFTKTRKGVLRLSYVLTDDLTAGLFYEYRTNETRLTGQRIDRDFGISLNISIRG